jgi:peptide/nickel transport system substrate-binding protein
LGRYLRWQAIIAILGIALLVALLRYTAYNFTSVTVPDKGGTLVEGMAGNPQYLNPLLSQYNQVDAVLCTLLFNGLTRLDQRGDVLPDLAESFAVSPDGLVYDFRLRNGLYWHDGVAVTAGDVLHTVGMMQDTSFPGVSWLSTLWRAVEVTAPEGPDGLAIRFTLEEAYAPFLDYTTIGLLPAHLWEKVPVEDMMASQLNTRPVGTGPFLLTSITATHAELVPNSTFYGPRPYLEGMTIRFYPDHQSLLPAYDRGEIDAVSWIHAEETTNAAKRQDINLFSAPISGYTLIYLNQANPNTPFFGETGVRQALLLGLNRQQLIDDVLRGQGLLAHSPILPGTWASDPDMKHYAYAPDEAKALLDAAGWVDADGDGVREKEDKKLAFVLLGSDTPILEAIAAQWAEIGVHAAPQGVTLAGLTADFLVPRTFDAALVHWELSGDPDPYPLWHGTQVKTGQNYAGWENRQADEAIERARSLADREARRQLYLEWQRIFADEVPSLLLYHPVYTYGVRNKLRDVQMGPLNTPGDRFQSIAGWYIVTKRVTERAAPVELDSKK